MAVQTSQKCLPPSRSTCCVKCCPISRASACSLMSQTSCTCRNCVRPKWPLRRSGSCSCRWRLADPTSLIQCSQRWARSALKVCSSLLTQFFIRSVGRLPTLQQSHGGNNRHAEKGPACINLLRCNVLSRRQGHFIYHPQHIH